MPDAARLAHDVRGGLTVIRGQCSSVARARSDVRRRAALRAIDAEVDRLVATLERHMHAGRPAPELIATARLVSDAALRHGPRAAGRDIALCAQVAPATGLVRARPAELEVALDNLLENALRHCAPGGVILLVATVAAGEQVVRVANDGDPVPAAERERVFLPGHRGRRARGAGAGLGLAIARDAVIDNGGRLELEPAARGCAFRITLPTAS